VVSASFRQKVQMKRTHGGKPFDMPTVREVLQRQKMAKSAGKIDRRKTNGGHGGSRRRMGMHSVKQDTFSHE